MGYNLSTDDYYALKLIVRSMEHYNDKETRSGKMARYIEEVKKILKRGREDE